MSDSGAEPTRDELLSHIRKTLPFKILEEDNARADRRRGLDSG